VSSPSGVRDGAQADNGLISADRLCSHQVIANSSPFRPEKWGTRAAQPGCVGDNVPPLLGPAGYRGEGYRSNENGLCFYSRQSLFSKVQVTEVSTPLTPIYQVNNI